MNAKENIFLEIQKMKQEYVTASELANSLELSRSVVSHYLNELVADGKISKSAGRPVRFALIGGQKKCNFIGANGSLKPVIEKVKAAVMYPPNGLNMLITGHSGVGKSYLAGKIVDFARQQGIIAQDAPYKVLNCADYANNPELISSILFGHVKGAYTGAENHTEGLLKLADQGFLFLDEVHRLSSESQEKLFNFIDTGSFYKMGDSSHVQKAQVRLILATTEDPKEVLLTTFLRRIPIKIEIPSYIERPLTERLDILRLLFYTEALTLQKDLRITGPAITALVNLDNQGNIGYLKSIIKVACASAYRQQAEANELVLDVQHFGLQVSAGIQELGQLSISYTRPISTSELDNQSEYVGELMELLARLATERDNSLLKVIRRKLIQSGDVLAEWQLASSSHYLHQKLYLDIIEEKFGLAKSSYLEKSAYGLYWQHIRLKEDELNSLAALCANDFSRAYHVSKCFYKELAQYDQSDYRSLVILLTLLISEYIDEKIKLRGILVAHGSGMATSIQKVVNSLCGNYIFDALDMPIDSGIDCIIAETKKLLSTFNTTNGFVLMVDMGSLGQLYAAIKDQLDGDLIVIDNLTTLTALDMALKMQSNEDFKVLAEKAEQDYKISVQYYEGFSQAPNILISCISGIGISERVKEIIEPLLPPTIKAIPLDYSSLKEKIATKEWNYFNNTLFVLTTMDLDSKLPFKHINLYNLLDTDGENTLRLWLKPYLSSTQIDNFFKSLLQFFSKEGIASRLAFLNPDKVLKEVEDINSKYEVFYHLRLDGKVKLNLYLHIALMIERLMVQDPNNFKAELTDSKEKQFFMITHSIFHPLEIKYNIHVSDYEISLLYELFKQFI